MLSNRKEYFYEVDLAWKSERTGTLSSLGKVNIEVATPNLFSKGDKGTWTPEHILAGAVSSSLMTNFLALAEGFQLDILGYKCHCFVKLEKKDGKLEASEMLIRPTIKLANNLDLPKAIELIEKADQSCPLKNVLKLRIEVHPQFEFLNRE
jgi:organic hydroperoxide reductase OsmC/OhrA